MTLSIIIPIYNIEYYLLDLSCIFFGESLRWFHKKVLQPPLNLRPQNYHKKISATSLLVTFLTVPAVVVAASGEKQNLETYTLPEVVVTATRTDQDVQKIPAAVQVITEKQIAAGGAVSVQEVLRQNTDIITGLHMPAGSELSLRGMNTNQTLVLVNGMPLNLGNRYQLNDIPAENIKKIEVVKGGGAVAV